MTILFKTFYSLFILSTLFNNILFDFAYAGEEKTKMVVKRPSVTMTRAPRGGKMGELYINSPVGIIEDKGDWALVNIKAWVKKEGLATAVKKVKKSNSISMPSKELVIEDYSTRIVEEGLPEKRLYLELKLKNNTKEVIKNWQAVLVATVKEQVAFREVLSDDSKSIAPGKSIKVNFYWEPSEKPFSYLETATPKGTVLKLYKVKFNTLN